MSTYAASSTGNLPRFDWVGSDQRGADHLLSGEYCNGTSAVCNGSATSTSKSQGLNGRMYLWPVNSDGTLTKDSSNDVHPSTAYWMNQRLVQGATADMLANAPSTSYFMSSSASYSTTLYTRAASSGFTATEYKLPYSLYSPEGLFGTSSHLWVVNEGAVNQDTGAQLTDPAKGARVLVMLDVTVLQPANP